MEMSIMEKRGPVQSLGDLNAGDWFYFCDQIGLQDAIEEKVVYIVASRGHKEDQIHIFCPDTGLELMRDKSHSTRVVNARVSIYQV